MSNTTLLERRNAAAKRKAEDTANFRTLVELATKTGKCYRSIHRAVQAGKIRTVYFGASRLIPPEEWERVLQHGWR
jgi:hypothetical protein